MHNFETETARAIDSYLAQHEPRATAPMRSPLRIALDNLRARASSPTLWWGVALATLLGGAIGSLSFLKTAAGL